MRQRSLSTFVCAAVFGLMMVVAVPMTHAQDKTPQDEHAAAEADHAAWLKELREMRVDHRRALAALRRLEAEILDHEAELEEQISEIEEHREHIESHEAALADGNSDSHDDHEAIEKRHAEIAKKMKSTHGDHKDLISGLMEFVKSHTEKFHSGHDH